MSNTLKLGNGKWATGKDTLLGYNSENNNIKPLPFSFSRASSATVVNKDGLIETVGSGEPRIDFKDNTKGALLLEPSRSNYSAYSELTSTWTYTEFGSGSAGTITTGKTDMFGGTNAVQIDFPSDAENVAIRFGSASSSLSSGDTSVSIYIKLVEIGSKDVQLRCNFTGLVNVNSTEFTRVDLSGTKTNSEAFNLKLRPSEGTSSGGFSIIVCHPQEEQGSYATSYIPTSGQANGVTRVAEVCNNGGNEQVINSTEGVLYAELSTLASDSVERFVSLSNGSVLNRVSLWYYAATNGLAVAVYSGNVAQFFTTTVLANDTLNNKIAIKYKLNDFSLVINGVVIATDTNGNAPIELNKLSFNKGDSNLPFYGNIKDVRVYNTALTDQELIALTS